jgi:hypothetical protein
MTISIISAQLGQSLGLPQLDLTNGEPVLVDLRGLEVALVYIEDLGSVVLRILVGQLSDDAPNRQALLTELMEANFNWRGTVGGTFAMDHFGYAYLQRQWLLPLKQGADLVVDLEKLVHLAETWRSKFEAAAVSAPFDGGLKI